MIRERVELSTIQKAAVKARKQFEDRKVDSRVLEKLYATYNPNVGDVALFVQRACELFPQLNCGLASVYLREILNLGTVTQGKYLDQNHTFLLIDEEEPEKFTVADITSDQYGGPPVYVGPLQIPWALKQK